MNTQKQTSMVNDHNTTHRNWCDLKPGDEIYLGGGWLEVFDAYPIKNDKVTVKVITANGIQTLQIQKASESKAICR